MNHLTIMGRLCAEPEVRQTSTGTHCCKIRVAVNRAVKSGEEKKADFLPVTCWGKTAEIVERYFHKGKMIVIEGRVQNNDYTDRNGVKHYAIDVVAEKIHFCGDNSGSDAPDVSYPSRGSYSRPAAQAAPCLVTEIRLMHTLKSSMPLMFRFNL